MHKTLIVWLLLVGSAYAEQIAAPPIPLDPDGTAEFALHLEQPLHSAATLAFEWSDAAGRLIDRRNIPVDSTSGIAIPLPIDLRRAVVMGNTLKAQLVQDGFSKPAVKLDFVAPPRDHEWSDWQTLLYQSRSPAQLEVLRQIGLTAAMMFANRANPTQRDLATIGVLIAQNLRWYVENIATDYYAPDHRWRPDRTETADFIAAKRLHQQAPHDLAAFTRVPSLSDPAAFAPIRARLAATVQTFAPYHPLYYSLADEPGIADLAAAWDFDFSPSSLAGFRSWLPTQYASLGALNAEWDSNFEHWADVTPDTTDQAMQRAGDNFAAWSDFKAWMDVAFSRALQAGTHAVHTADPHALAAIEGAQIPGWGGYDYSRLAPAVDAMEIYDFGQNIDLARSFNPNLVMLSTISGGSRHEVHALWRSLMLGMRGAILWDETITLANPDGTLGEDGRRLEPTLRALHDGVGALLINSKPDPAPIAILYSPESFRAEWILNQRPKGSAWASRDAEAEYQDTPMRAAIRGFSHLAGHLGMQGRFISPQMIRDGALERDGIRVLILPHVLALSAAEADAIRSFAGSGGMVIADSVPGAFDEHGRRQHQPLLASLFAGSATLFPLGEGDKPDAADGRDPAALDHLAALFAQTGISPDLRLSTPAGQRVTDVTVSRYHLGSDHLYALQRDFSAQPAQDATAAMTLALPTPRNVSIARDGHSPIETAHLALTLDALAPVLLTLSDAPMVEPGISAPTNTDLGQDAVLELHTLHPGSVLHVEVHNPDGAINALYSGNLVAESTRAVWRVPLALNDPPGLWSITAIDVGTGQHASVALHVAEPPGRW